MIKNLRSFMRSLDRATNEEINLADRYAFKTALAIEADAKRLIQRGQPTGRVYKRGNVSHRASAPYEAPATDTGQLVRNITTQKKKKLLYTTGSRRQAGYGKALEYGTVNMKPRPWLSVAVRNVKAKQKLAAKIGSIK